MIDLWIIFAIVSGAFVSAREMYIKKNCNQSPEIISFTTRFYGSIVLCIVATGGGVKITNIPVFFGITFVTVVVTTFTTIVRLRLIKEEELSLTTPWLGAVPLFMVIWSILLFRQLPSTVSLLGILLVCAGAFFINFKGGTFAFRKASLLMLLNAVLAGLTTCLDRFAIGASTAITYSLIWTIMSAALMYGVAKTKTKKVLVIDKHLMIQAVFWVGEFVFQMLAVQNISSSASGPTYVKTLTMLNIVITTVVSGFIFREKDMKRRILSAILIFLGAAVLVLFR